MQITEPVRILPDISTPLSVLHDTLTPRATSFIADFVRYLRPAIERQGAARCSRRGRASRDLPDFRADTKATRQDEWRCRLPPSSLGRRRVGVLGPPSASALDRARGADADWFVADFEDATSPTFSNVLQGQADLRDAIASRLDSERPMMLFVRPRGLHSYEHHFVVDGLPAPAALFDLALFCHHNADLLVSAGSGPFFYVPKIETYEDAIVWDAAFRHLESSLGIAPGTLKVTVSIDTISAAFQMHEILWALRSRCVALHFGRRELVFDFIKTRASDPCAVLPDRRVVMMDRAFLAGISALLVKTAHRRGIDAVGGMATHVPATGSHAHDAQVLALLRAEKAREAEWGYDATLVANPNLLPAAREVFDAFVSEEEGPVERDDVHVRREELLSIPSGARTEESVRSNLRLLLVYLDQWLNGNGFVEVEQGVVDAAAAEIARVQLWKWVHYSVRLDDGVPLTTSSFKEWLADEGRRLGTPSHVRDFVERLCLAPELTDFMTLEAYGMLTSHTSNGSDVMLPQEAAVMQ